MLEPEVRFWLHLNHKILQHVSLLLFGLEKRIMYMKYATINLSNGTAIFTTKRLSTGV